MGMSSWQCRSRPTMHFYRTKLICVCVGLCDCVCVSLQCLVRSRYMTVICFRGSANTTWLLRANVSIKTLIQGDNHTNVQIMKHKDTDITQMAHTHTNSFYFSLVLSLFFYLLFCFSLSVSDGWVSDPLLDKSLSSCLIISTALFHS